MDDYGFPVICDDCGVEANLEADNWGLHSGVVVCENCAQSEEYEYLFDAETFGAEDDLTFQEWADQEMMTHGKPEPFDDWLDDELSHHGDNVSLHDWGNHELDSHYERYGAESKTHRRIKQEAAYSQMMIASLIGLGAGLWGVSKWRDSQRSL
jgi:hypothetical protein